LVIRNYSNELKKKSALKKIKYTEVHTANTNIDTPRENKNKIHPNYETWSFNQKNEGEDLQL